MKARVFLRKIGVGFFRLVLAAAVSIGHAAGREMVVSVVTDQKLPPGAAHGFDRVVAALKARGVEAEKAESPDAAKGRMLIVAGLASGSGPAAQLLKESDTKAPDGPEALVIRVLRWKGKPAVLVCGADDRGLMYAELDVADRIGWANDAANPLSEIRDAAEKPACPERALSIYTMQRAYFESRLYDEKYWDRYFDVLAANRFNSFVLIFGYENGGYMAPPYPYFFDVEQFPDVKCVGITKEQQQRNLDSLNRLIRQAHAHGISVTLGIWDHIYRGGVQGGGPRENAEAARKPTPGLVWGVTGENLIAYTKAALAEFIRQVPEVDALQFRMHDESGLKQGEQYGFWKDVFQQIKAVRPNIRFDARAKGLPDNVIDAGLEAGVKLRITTKYWMEQMGLPFHPTHINKQNQRDRRHGYADLLRYPQRYKMHWRLWNGGTARVLLWGDPDYVRRFAGSTHLYGGDGFEVNEPLCTKMEAQPHDLTPFELMKPPYKYYDYEFERYWHFFQVWGRVGYNPDAPAEIWEREFERRFGKEAAPHLERALHRASWVLPRIVAACYPYGSFPMTRGWAEKQRLGDLPAYARAEGSDIQQFANFDEETQNILEGKETAKTRPPETAAWFAQAAREILQDVAEAEKKIGARRNKEFDSTVVDLEMLAYLALYHSQRMAAAVRYDLYKRSGDLAAFGEACGSEGRAVDAWRRLVQEAGDVYADDLMMGFRGAALCGHWRDELAELEKGLGRLREQRDAIDTTAAVLAGIPRKPASGPAIAHVPIRKARPGERLEIRATVCGPEAITRVRLGYRAAQGQWEYAPMERVAPFVYRAVVPGASVSAGLNYHLEAEDAKGRKATWPSEGPAQPVAPIVSADNEPPAVRHTPILKAPAGRPLTIAAEVSDPSGVKWARVLYRSVNQMFDYQELPMKQAGAKGRYEAVIPGEQLDPKWDFMYLIEVMDTAGNGQIYPDLEKETPYVVVKLTR